MCAASACLFAFPVHQLRPREGRTMDSLFKFGDTRAESPAPYFPSRSSDRAGKPLLRHGDGVARDVYGVQALKSQQKPIEREERVCTKTRGCWSQGSQGPSSHVRRTTHRPKGRILSPFRTKTDQDRDAEAPLNQCPQSTCVNSQTLAYLQKEDEQDNPKFD